MSEYKLEYTGKKINELLGFVNGNVITGTAQMASSWTDNGGSIKRNSNTVELVINAIKSSSAQDGETIMTIPSEFAPDKELDFSCAIFNENDYPMIGWIAVMPDGVVKVKNYLANNMSGRQFKGVCRFFI